MYKAFSLVTFFFLLVSCKDNSLISVNQDSNYVRCNIDGAKWENSGGGIIIPSHSMSLTVENNIITEIHLRGQKYKDENSNQVGHDVISIRVAPNIPLDQLECPISFNLQNTSIGSSYSNGFITHDELKTYNYNVPQDVIHYGSTSGNLILETLDIYKSCGQKPGVLDANGNCYKFTGSFNFIGKNSFNEEKEITNGVFKHKVTVN